MLYSIINAIQSSAVEIYGLLQKKDVNYLESKNSTGDIQLEIDVLANNILKDSLLELSAIKGICSEEEKDIIIKNESGIYMVAFDPLDGSSILDSNLSVGTIFGVYNGEFRAKNLIASGYILYGPKLEMIIAQEEVQHLIFNGGEWISSGNLVLREKGKINAPGGTQKDWSTRHKILIESLFSEGYRLRYSGGMVPDLHQILRKGGGLFSYPSTKNAPNGKLRAFFEVFPFAFIFEKAGGGAIDGKTRLLDLEVDSTHASLPCFFGSKYEINQVKIAYKE